MKENLILPNYEHCILNTITSILKYYKVNTNHKTLPILDPKLEQKYDNIVFIILDGEGKKAKKSTHCGLTKDEMEVPLIVID